MKPFYHLAFSCVLFSFCFLLSCTTTEMADKIIFNAQVFCVEEGEIFAEAIAIKDGKILQVGSEEHIMVKRNNNTEMIDADGNFVMPGLIEGHGHLLMMGESLAQLNLNDAESWEEIVNLVAAATAEADPGQWIVGNSWHQDKWLDTPADGIDGYPTHHSLSSVSPDHPVLLYHASYHALFANAKAMELADINKNTPNPDGGLIRRDAEGEAIGVFEETAMGLIRSAYTKERESWPVADWMAQKKAWIQRAEQEAFSYGITSFHDLGLPWEDLKLLRSMAASGELDISVFAMVREPIRELERSIAYLPIINEGETGFTVRTVKAFVDGALGSYGALLLEPYSDQPETYGQLVTSIEVLEDMANLCIENGLQFSVHAIGDSANRIALDIYEAAFDHAEKLKNARWRIEHAQHLHPDDIPRFGELGILASMQGIHCASDAPFVPTRLGEKRSRDGAYVWRSLIESGARINNGTDVPVESIDPFESLYASVARKKPQAEKSFYPEQKMTRLEALQSYTINNAFAAFEEKTKGSIKSGKRADIIILDRNLLICPDEDLPNTQVLKTLVGGKVVFSGS